MFHGPRASVGPYFSGLGFLPPSDGAEHNKTDTCDWLVSMLANPEAAHAADIRALAAGAAAAGGLPLGPDAEAARGGGVGFRLVIDSTL